MEMEIYRERERLNNKQRIYGNRPKKNHSIDEVEVASTCMEIKMNIKVAAQTNN